MQTINVESCCVNFNLHAAALRAEKEMKSILHEKRKNKNKNKI